MKSEADATVNSATNPGLRSPEGKARILVRGLAASMYLSASRLNAIAAERAPIMATTSQAIVFKGGIPRAASMAPSSANGSAKSVCSILIISSVTRRLRKNRDALLRLSSLSLPIASAGRVEHLDGRGRDV